MEKALLITIFVLMLMGCSSGISYGDQRKTEQARNKKLIRRKTQTYEAEMQNYTPAPTRKPAPAQEAKYDTLKCQDCKDAGILINIWSHPDRSGIVSKVPHGTRVEILDTTTYDGIKYYKIRVNGKTGYVRDWFILGHSY